MDRLERFEKALKDILEEYDKLGQELEKMFKNIQKVVRKM